MRPEWPKPLIAILADIFVSPADSREDRKPNEFPNTLSWKCWVLAQRALRSLIVADSAFGSSPGKTLFPSAWAPDANPASPGAVGSPLDSKPGSNFLFANRLVPVLVRIRIQNGNSGLLMRRPFRLARARQAELVSRQFRRRIEWGQRLAGFVLFRSAAGWRLRCAGPCFFRHCAGRGCPNGDGAAELHSTGDRCLPASSNTFSACFGPTAQPSGSAATASFRHSVFICKDSLGGSPELRAFHLSTDRLIFSPEEALRTSHSMFRAL